MHSQVGPWIFRNVHQLRLLEHTHAHTHTFMHKPTHTFMHKPTRTHTLCHQQRRQDFTGKCGMPPVDEGPQPLMEISGVDYRWVLNNEGKGLARGQLWSMSQWWLGSFIGSRVSPSSACFCEVSPPRRQGHPCKLLPSCLSTSYL